MTKAQYDTEVVIYGEVSLLGDLFCPCFELTSGGEQVMIWYDLVVEDGESVRQRAPSAYGVFGVVYNGLLLTYHVIGPREMRRLDEVILT